MSNELKTVGFLLVGHGTRDDVGTQQYLELAEGVKESFAPLPVEAAFLELAQPDIEAGVARLLERGVDEIVTVPVILFAAGHVKRDIPRRVGEAVEALGRSNVRQLQVGHLGCHTALAELSRMRQEESERGGPSEYGVPEEDPGKEKVVGTVHPTCLLLVARGSSDLEAAEEMRQFAAMRQMEFPGVQVEVAFLAKARPSFDEKLAEIKALLRPPADAVGVRAAAAPGGAGSTVAPSYQRIFVQPHFLFEGELVERIRGQIGKIAAGDPRTEWIVTQPLADPPGKTGLASELLRKVILERCQEGGIRVVVSGGDD